MSVFSDLMLEAKVAGANTLCFVVDIEDFTGHSDRVRWTVRSFGDVKMPHVAVGRSGEEALRELVAFLKKV